DPARSRAGRCLRPDPRDGARPAAPDARAAPVEPRQGAAARRVRSRGRAGDRRPVRRRARRLPALLRADRALGRVAGGVCGPMRASPRTLLLLSTSSGPGGAERMLSLLASSLQRAGLRVIVGLFRPGWLKSECERLGVDTRVIPLAGPLHSGWFREV